MCVDVYYTHVYCNLCLVVVQRSNFVFSSFPVGFE